MAGKTAQKRSRLLFYGLIRLRLRNSGLRPSDSLDAAGSFRLIKFRKRSLCFAAVLSPRCFSFFIEIIFLSLLKLTNTV